MNMLLKAQDEAAQRHVRVFAAMNNHVHELSSLLPKSTSVFAATASLEKPCSGSSQILAEEVGDANLQERIAALQEQLEQDQSDAAREIDAAYDRGRSEGEKLAQSLEQQKLDMLAASIDEAQKLLGERTDSLQTLSLQIAQVAMSRILGDHHRYANLIADNIVHRAGQLSEELIIAIRVSPDDFADPESLAALSSNTKRTDIVIDPVLASGACMFDLKLGRLDAGLTLQWNHLVDFLDKLADAKGTR